MYHFYIAFRSLEELEGIYYLFCRLLINLCSVIRCIVLGWQELFSIKYLMQLYRILVLEHIWQHQ